MVAAILFPSLVALALGYVVYGRFLARRLGVDPARSTPAFADPDRRDYVAARAPVLFGHHFSSIAGAGPIVGPVIAAAAFGWLPAVLWIVAGSIFVGGVQDFSSLMASIRHRARSVADIARQHISPLAHRLFLVFVWFALVYVIVVFVDLTATTFVEDPGVASSSIMYVGLAVVFGLLVYRRGASLAPATAVFVPLVFLGIWLGQQWPVALPLAQPRFGWNLLLLAYCLVASVLPVWSLLQPRDYLSSFLLFGALAGAVVGIAAGGGSVPDGVVALPAIATFSDASLGLLFPAMFITIACGACSGFHAIVASGTTAKQLSAETHARPVAYGSMLLEGVLALVAVGTVVLIGAQAARGQAPTFVFAQGIGHILSAVGIPASLGAHFGALAISTFLLTTLDTCTRLARYVLEELFGLQRAGLQTTIVATLGSLALPALLTRMTLHLPDGTPAAAWRVIWPIFGATNQLLGALAMLVVAIWLRNEGRRHAFIALPMLFMFVVTMVALGQLVLRYGALTLIGGIAAGLFVLAVILAVEAGRRALGSGPIEAAVGRT